MSSYDRAYAVRHLDGVSSYDEWTQRPDVIAYDAGYVVFGDAREATKYNPDDPIRECSVADGPEGYVLHF